MKYFIYIVIAVVAVAIVAGFFIVGSPQNKRLQNFDNQRVSDLQNLQSQIIDYWQRKQVLPTNLASLNDSIRGIVVPKDPETAADYGYSAKPPLTFTLCANFSLPSTDHGTPQAAPIGSYGAGNWSHGAGQTCFDRIIDPTYYKPYPSVSPVPIK